MIMVDEYFFNKTILKGPSKLLLLKKKKLLIFFYFIIENKNIKNYEFNIIYSCFKLNSAFENTWNSAVTQKTNFFKKLNRLTTNHYQLKVSTK